MNRFELPLNFPLNCTRTKEDEHALDLDLYPHLLRTRTLPRSRAARELYFSANSANLMSTAEKCHYQYVLEHPYKLYAGPPLTPLPFTTTTSLTTPYCAMFIELFLLEHLRCFFVTDDRQRRVFCRERRPWQSCTAGGGRTSHAFTSISVSKGSFRWRLAWRVTDVCESTQHECEWWKTTIVLRIAACEGSRTARLSRRRGPKGHPSAPVQLRVRPSTSSLLWPLIPLLANLLIFFLPKSKSSSSRSSVLSACRSIFTKKIVPVVTRDGRALQCMHILWYSANQTFSNSYLAKTPSALFVGNTDLKKIWKLRTTP